MLRLINIGVLVYRCDYFGDNWLSDVSATCSSFLYLVFALILGATCKRQALHSDYMIAEKVNNASLPLLAAAVLFVLLQVYLSHAA